VPKAYGILLLIGCLQIEINFSPQKYNLKYAEVILPLSLEKVYTFGVPYEMQSTIRIGSRVEVQFGKKKIYSGEQYAVKPIRSLLDTEPLLHPDQLKFWEWMASYYMCSEGDVMNAALPAFLKLESDTFIQLNDEFDINALELTDDEYIVLQALQIRLEKQKRKSAKDSSQENTNTSLPTEQT
jgi:primosomal protein N' (replication factor Y)